jgi:hypothetical protein
MRVLFSTTRPRGDVEPINQNGEISATAAAATGVWL